MKNKYIAVLCFIGLLLSGCYEDKGNYDYKDIDELAISFEKPYYNITFGEKLELKPVINREIEENSSRYMYTWYVNGETRPEWNTRNFSWTVDEMLKNAYVALEIRDLTNDISYMNRVSFDVTGIYENDYSWMILSDVGGKSQLSFFSSLEYDREKQEFVKTHFYEDVYSAVNGGELGQGPIALQEHYREGVDWKDEIIGNVCVFQKSGAVDLNGQSFEKEVDMAGEFDGGVYPEGAVIYPATFMDRLEVLADQRGRLYSRYKALSTVYYSEFFLPTPLTFPDETEPLEQCQVVRGFYRSNRTGYAVIYDGKNKRLLYIVNSDGDDFGEAGEIRAFPACGENDNLADIVPLNDMQGYELIKIMMCGMPSENWDSWYGFFLLLKEESSGRLFLQIVTTKGASGKPQIIKIDRHEVTGLPATPSLFALPLYEPEYVFLAVGNDVYYYDLNNPQSPVGLYRHFDAKVTAINACSAGNRHLAVGLESGDFYVLLIDEAKNVPADRRVLYQSDRQVGRIVDIQYKELDHWNY